MQDRSSPSVRPWFWQEADMVHKAVITVVNTSWATEPVAVTDGSCLRPLCSWQYRATKAHPTFHVFTAVTSEAFLQCFLCCRGQEDCSTSEQDRCSLSFSQLLPKLKLSSPETALALQKGSGEGGENSHSSLQPPVLP